MHKSKRLRFELCDKEYTHKYNERDEENRSLNVATKRKQNKYTYKISRNGCVYQVTFIILLWRKWCVNRACDFSVCVHEMHLQIATGQRYIQYIYFTHAKLHPATHTDKL